MNVISVVTSFSEVVLDVIRFIRSASLYSYLSAGIIFFGYILQSSLLQYFFYYQKNPIDSKKWKIQQEKNIPNLGIFWTIPIFSMTKPGRAKNHVFLTTLNLINATLFAFFVTELCVQNKSKIVFLSVEEYGIHNIIKDLIIAVIYENFVEYYWHRFLHSKIMYKKYHKYHHYVKSPEPWDDMYIHPIEAIIYYCILYSPPFLFSCHYYAFIFYMIIMGLCGTLDHSGVNFKIPGTTYFFVFISSVLFFVLRLIACNVS